MSKLFDQALASVSEDVKRFVDHSINVSDQIHAILTEKDISQRGFAEMLGKKESEVSKWLTGRHNFTLKSIAKIEAVLGESIITTPQVAKKNFGKVQFVKIKTHAEESKRIAHVNNPVGDFKEPSMTPGQVKTGKTRIFDKGLKIA